MKLKLFPKFLSIMVILAVVPLIIVGLRMININRVALQGSILELHTHMASSLAEKIDDYMSNLEGKLSFIVNSENVTGMSWAQRQAMLQSLLETSRHFVNISVVDKEGNELIKVYNPAIEKAPSLVKRTPDDSLRKALGGRYDISPVYYSNHKPRINIVYPFGKDHVIFIETSLEAIWDRIRQSRIGNTGFAFMVDSAGRIIAHPDPDKAERFEDASNLDIVKAVLSGSTVGSAEFKDAAGVDMVGAYAPLAMMKWGLVIQQAKSDAYSSAVKMRRDAIVWIMISIIAAAFVGLATARSLTKPVFALIRGAERVADGDFNQKVKVTSRDELEMLADTFNKMTGRLKQYNDMNVDRIIEEKTKTDAVIYSIADGLIMTDFSGRVMLLNRQARNMLDVKQEIDNISLLDYIKDKSIAESLREMIIEKKDEKTTKEFRINKRIIEARTDTVKTEKGKNLGILTILHDITLEKQLETMKDDFIHSITHDLRSPMTSIRGFMEILLDGSAGEITEQQREFLQIMDDSSKKLLGLINNILDVAKLESGKIDITLSRVNAGRLVNNIVKALKLRAEKGQITLRAKETAKLPDINADAGLLERTIENLISNALKFTPAGGRVSVETEDFEDRIQVSVTDTGEGIPQNFLNKVFDKFQQVENSMTKKKGTGLGLAISRYIVEAHRGKIWVESEPGKGSKFQFYIPKNLGKNDSGQIIIGG